jgi:hypothetical protein
MSAEQQAFAPELALSVGSGTRKGLNTDLTTAEGLQAAGEFILREYPEVETWKHELTLNMAASDWQNGHEERAMKMLTREYDLMCATRIVSYLVATPGRVRG